MPTEKEHLALVERVELLAIEVRENAVKLSIQAEEHAGMKAAVHILQNYDLQHQKNIQTALKASEEANRAAADALAVVRTALALRKELPPSE